MLFKNYYELLGVPVNASKNDIYKAYKNKIIKCTNEKKKEEYDTAYYVLTNEKNRYNYDVSIGIKKYRIVPRYYKVFKALARVILTVIDSVMDFYRCFFIVLVFALLMKCICEYFIVGVSGIKKVLFFYKELILAAVIALFAVVILQFYVRRANRKLKYYNWEYKK